MKKLLAAAQLAQHCMANRNGELDKKRRKEKRAVEWALRARVREMCEEGEMLASRIRVRVKPHLSWEEEYYKDMRRSKRCAKHKERLLSKSRRQPVILIEM